MAPSYSIITVSKLKGQLTNFPEFMITPPEQINPTFPSPKISVDVGF